MCVGLVTQPSGTQPVIFAGATGIVVKTAVPVAQCCMPLSEENGSFVRQAVAPAINASVAI